MTILRKLLGFGERRAVDIPVENDQRQPVKPDQLSVDVAIASQQNSIATLRVRETLADMLKANDEKGRVTR